jgi:hypothetical protein
MRQRPEFLRHTPRYRLVRFRTQFTLRFSSLDRRMHFSYSPLMLLSRCSPKHVNTPTVPRLPRQEAVAVMLYSNTYFSFERSIAIA